MKPQGIIFDFNGVLFWDTPLHDAAWRELSAKLRGRPLTDKEMGMHVHGRTNKDTLEYVLSRQVSSPELHDLTGQKETAYRQQCLALGQDFQLSPGSVKLLDALLDHDVPRAIATSSEKNNVDFFIEHLGLDRWFDLDTIVYDDGTMAGKPSPDIYLRAAERLKLQPSVCLVIEDAIAGIASAHAAGPCPASC